jgi:hypothetical protein
MWLSRWFGEKRRRAAAQKSSAIRPGMGLDEAVAAVAALQNEAAIAEAARQFPLLFGPEAIPELMRRFDRLAEPPPDFSAREPSACAWIACWHVALHEILLRYGEHAVPVFRAMACEGNNATAVVLLCRLASENMDRGRIVADLKGLLPDLPPVVRCDIAARLLGSARTSPDLASVVEELRQVAQFEESLAEAQSFEDGGC